MARRTKARRRGKKRSRRRPWPRPALLGLTVVILGAIGVWLAWPFWQLSAQLATARSVHPSRVYGQPFGIAVDRFADLAGIRAELDHLGYRVVAGMPRPGQYDMTADGLAVWLRPSPRQGGRNPGGLLEIEMRGRRVRALRLAGKPVAEASFEPPVLATYLGPGMRDRIAVPLGEISENLIHAVLAAEDSSFFSHAGLSPTGIVRAAWVNIRGGGVSQGGSTLTQQLVKNLFLTHERTWTRKIRELVLALLVDLRYDKQAILETYLNEIYWGTDGVVNLMGVGSAAWGYFGKRASELSLCESTVLAAIIRSPGRYSPSRHPERVIERRNAILERMAELGWLEPDRLEAALDEALCVSPQRVPIRKAPYFAEFAADEAVRRFGVDPRTTPGLALLSTLDRTAQEAANAAVGWGLEALESGWEKGRASQQPLQAALLSVDPRTGAIRAYVGGRDFSRSQFDRVRAARRQAGSAFKPVVYASALEAGAASPVTLVEDSPITVVLAGRRWSPQNSDGDYRGWVTARTALEESLNIPTVRIALATRLPQVVDTARALGITTELKALPALALGAFEVTPLDLTTVFATFASGGVRRDLFGLEAVLDENGLPISGTPLTAERRVLTAETAYQVTSMLQGVLDRGTARSVRDQGLSDPLAGKTGTTNDRRDSWFAGYSPDRATLVWVGYDDSSPTRLSGARAALPIWARYTWKVRPAGGYPVFEMPSGMTTAVIDPVSGELATDDCPTVITEVFAVGTRPRDICRLHSSWRDWRPRRQPDQFDIERDTRRFRWLKKLFRRDRRG